ncbi:MAG: ComEC/Rec2 family competence protein, partial [Myxococcales bacterium]|nr:ComEC/Rec2 family competence protein [Myxococcales bacterium]
MAGSFVQARRLPRFAYSVHWASGIAAGVALADTAGADIVAGLSALLGIVVWLLFRRRTPWLVAGLAVTTGLLAGALRYGCVDSTLDLPPDRSDVAFAGCLRSGVRQNPHGWSASADVRLDGSDALVHVRIAGNDRVELAAGDCISGRGSFHRPARPLHQYTWDPRRMARAEGIVGTIYLEAGSARRTGRSNTVWLRIRRTVEEARADVEHRLRQIVPPEDIGWVLALGTGTRSELGEDAVRALRDSGMAHLLAISGLHLGLTLVFLTSILRRLIRRVSILTRWFPSHRLEGPIAIVLAWTYCLFTGAATSTVRAALFLSIVWSQELLGLRRDGAASLSLTGAVLLLLHPDQLFLPGFQLSFVAVAAILIASHRPPSNGGARFSMVRVGALLAGLARVSLFVAIATAPITAYHFGVISVSGVFANMLVAPWLSVGLVGSAGLAVFFSPWWSPASRLCAEVCCILGRVG